MNYTEKARQLEQAMEELHYAYFNAYDSLLANKESNRQLSETYKLFTYSTMYAFSTTHWRNKKLSLQK